MLQKHPMINTYKNSKNLPFCQQTRPNQTRIQLLEGKQNHHKVPNVTSLRSAGASRSNPSRRSLQNANGVTLQEAAGITAVCTVEANTAIGNEMSSLWTETMRFSKILGKSYGKEAKMCVLNTMQKNALQEEFKVKILVI